MTILIKPLYSDKSADNSSYFESFYSKVTEGIGFTFNFVNFHDKDLSLIPRSVGFYQTYTIQENIFLRTEIIKATMHNDENIMGQVGVVLGSSEYAVAIYSVIGEYYGSKDNGIVPVIYKGVKAKIKEAKFHIALDKRDKLDKLGFKFNSLEINLNMSNGLKAAFKPYEENDNYFEIKASIPSVQEGEHGILSPSVRWTINQYFSIYINPVVGFDEIPIKIKNLTQDFSNIFSSNVREEVKEKPGTESLIAVKISYFTLFDNPLDVAIGIKGILLGNAKFMGSSSKLTEITLDFVCNWARLITKMVNKQEGAALNLKNIGFENTVLIRIPFNSFNIDMKFVVSFKNDKTNKIVWPSIGISFPYKKGDQYEMLNFEHEEKPNTSYVGVEESLMSKFA